MTCMCHKMPTYCTTEARTTIRVYLIWNLLNSTSTYPPSVVTTNFNMPTSYRQWHEGSALQIAVIVPCIKSRIPNIQYRNTWSPAKRAHVASELKMQRRWLNKRNIAHMKWRGRESEREREKEIIFLQKWAQFPRTELKRNTFTNTL